MAGGKATLKRDHERDRTPVERSLSCPSPKRQHPLHRRGGWALLGGCALVLASLGGALPAGLARASEPSWEAIDRLRSQLERAGVTVVQRDCGARGLQGLYHQPSDTIVICRVHRTPRAVWNTLAHEATHRMQICFGRPITDPRHHRAMANALARHSPRDLQSLLAYPASQRVGELEARYTAQLPPAHVIGLFEKYCGSTLRPLALAPSPRR
jgi:hypothetical protein